MIQANPPGADELESLRRRIAELEQRERERQGRLDALGDSQRQLHIKAEEQLKEREEFFHTLAEMSPTAPEIDGPRDPWDSGVLELSLRRGAG